MKKTKGAKRTRGKRSGRKKKKLKRISVGPVALGVAICLLLVLICLPLIRQRAKEYGAQVPEDSFSYILDISHHQKSVNWDSLLVMTDAKGRTVRSPGKAVRVKAPDYVVMKASEGENFQDECFGQRWKEAADRGIRRGAYHFFRAERDPRRQAENFARTVGQLSFRDLPPVLDVEILPSGMKRREFNDRVLSCLKEIETRFGRRPIVYAPDSFMTDILDSSIVENYSLWVAGYEREKPLCGNWDYWQFSDKAVVHGIDGKVDLSVIR